MPEFELYETFALGGRAPLGKDLPGLRIEEVAGRALVSVAARLGAEARLAQAVSSAFGVALPGPGRHAAGPAVGFAWMGQQQWFADAAVADVPDLLGALAGAAGDSASLTEQSDAWARLRLAGPAVGPVLEKLCPLDLHPSRFPPGAVARTSMEHLGAVILRPAQGEGVELWTARSSAPSFLEALLHAAHAARPEERVA